jgi:hypothetical protein
MVTFNYIEDYIEFIGGYRDINNRKLGLFDTVASPVSLARYDIKIIDSLASQTAERNIGYTDKQAELARKIVVKYRRQLSQLPQPVAVDENIKSYRMGIRQVDRSRRAFIRDNKIILKFPYDIDLITAVKVQSRDGDGSGVFLAEEKLWQFGVTESVVNWICTISEKHNIEVDKSVTDLYVKILECEQQPYAIELVDTGTGYDITNAAENLKDYIITNLGGFGYDNLLMLIDNAEVLGYTVPDGLLLQFYKQFRPTLSVRQRLCTAKNRRRFNKSTGDLEEIVEYARATNRLPVYVYATGLPKTSTEEVKYLRQETVDTKIKCLVSESRLLVGTRKQAWMKQAEKIFYLE